MTNFANPVGNIKTNNSEITGFNINMIKNLANCFRHGLWIQF